MSSIIPEDIKTIEEARKWLHKRGWGLALTEEELAKWEAPVVTDDIEEEEIIEEWDDEDEDDSWDDEEDDEDDDWDEDEDDDEDDNK